jgi:N-acetyl-D-muramate 6-phosphate phosphatase
MWMSTTWSAVVEMETSDVSRPRQVRLVLFDLDGTFADTAPDLAFALNRTLAANDRPQLPLETIRLQVSHGAVALIMLGFGIGPDHPRFDAHREQLLGIYQQHLARETTLFPGMEELLEQLEQRNIAWGIVTNKPGWLTEPLMQQLGFSERAAAIVSGDTTGYRKPHPTPIIHACGLARCDPAETLYIGDARRDIEAGNSAGNTTLTALFGYIGNEDKPEEWGADGAIEHPLEVLDWIDREI